MANDVKTGEPIFNSHDYKVVVRFPLEFRSRVIEKRFALFNVLKQIKKILRGISQNKLINKWELIAANVVQ